MGVWSIDIICGDDSLEVGHIVATRTALSVALLGTLCCFCFRLHRATEVSFALAQVFRRMLLAGGIDSDRVPSSSRAKHRAIALDAEDGKELKILAVRHTEGFPPPRE